MHFFTDAYKMYNMRDMFANYEVGLLLRFLRYLPFILYGGDLWLSGTREEAIIDDRCQDMNGN